MIRKDTTPKGDGNFAVFIFFTPSTQLIRKDTTPKGDRSYYVLNYLVEIFDLSPILFTIHVIIYW